MSVWDESPLPPPVAGTSAAPPPSDPPSAPGGDPDEPEPPRRVLGLPIWLAVVLGSVIGVAVAAALVFSVGSDDDDPAATGTVQSTPTATAPPPTTLPPTVATTTTTTPTTMTPTTVTPTTVTPTTAAAIPATTTPSTTTPTTTPSTTTSATTDPPATIAPTTIAPTTIAPTTTPATTTPEPTTAVGVDGQRLTVTPRRGPCGTATDCLVVSFTIDGFAIRPQTFVCEFASGRRFEFRFSGDGVDRACATNDVPDSIVVEVGGLRSDPVTNSR